MQIPGYPQYEWHDGKVWNSKTKKCIEGGIRRRFYLRNEEGVKCFMTSEQIESLCLQEHPRDMDGITACTMPNIWYHEATNTAYQEIDGTVHVLRTPSKGKHTVFWNGRSYRINTEELITIHFDNIDKSRRGRIVQKRVASKKNPSRSERFQKAKKESTAKSAVTKKKSRKKPAKKRHEIIPVPGFNLYLLNGDEVISSYGVKRRVLEPRNGNYVMLNNLEQRCRMTLEQVKELCQEE